MFSFDVHLQETRCSVCVCRNPVDMCIPAQVFADTTPKYLAWSVASSACPWSVYMYRAGFLDLVVCRT